MAPRGDGDLDSVEETHKILSPYLQFYINECSRLKEEKKKINNAVRKALGLQWASMSDIENKPYIDKYHEQKLAHEKRISKGKLKDSEAKKEDKKVQLFDYWSGIPSRGYALSDGCGRIHAWGTKEVAKILNRFKGERPSKKLKVLAFDEECSEDKNQGERKEGSTNRVMELLEKLISEMGEMKDTLNYRFEKENKIEESLKDLTAKCKGLIDQVAGLNANMIYIKRALRIIDAKFDLGLDKEESMEDKEEFEESKPENTISGDCLQLVEVVVIPSKEDDSVHGLKPKKVQTKVEAM